MKVNTTRFGVLEVEDSSVLAMPRGLLGFEDNNEFCLIQHRPDTNFRWLQSTEDPSLAFVVVDPADFFMGYDIEIPDAEAEKLKLEKAEDALVVVIVTIKDEGKTITANLAAPIVINSKELLAMQVVLQDSRFHVAHPLVEGVPAQNADGSNTTDETKKVEAA